MKLISIYYWNVVRMRIIFNSMKRLFPPQIYMSIKCLAGFKVPCNLDSCLKASKSFPLPPRVSWRYSLNRLSKAQT